LLDDVGDPAIAKRLPGDRSDRARPEQRPQRHFDRAGVGRGNNADLVVSGNFKHFARQIDRELELGLADLRAMRTAEGGLIKILGVQPGRLAQGPEEKCGTDGFEPGFATVIVYPSR
jgi:hypothetical protein